MTMQGSQDGVAAFMEYAFVAAPGGQSRFVGADSKGFVLNYASGFLWAVVDGFWVAPDDFSATDGSSITFTTAVDQGTHVRLIALSPFNVANVYSQLQSDTLYAKRRNRIIDPGMRVSQENGNNATTANAVGYYVSDSCFSARNTAAGGATVQRIALQTPGGSPYRTRVTITTANPTPAAGDEFILGTNIEGIDIADLNLGLATAKQLTRRYGFRSSVSGTFTLYARNGASNRSWLGSVTIAPGEVNQDVVKTVTFVGDTTGTWATDNTKGIEIGVNLCAGSSRQGVAGWQAGSFTGLASGVNLMATNGATFDLFDVGLYDVTGLQNGVIPPFELAEYLTDVLRCQRYFYASGFTSNAGYNVSNANVYLVHRLPVQMRVTPSMGFTSGGPTYGNGYGGTLVNPSTDQFQSQWLITNTGYGFMNFTYAANARL